MSTISYKTFNVEALKLTVPEENKQIPDITKYQLMSFPRYLKDGKEVIPQIQGPWMNLFTYGIGGKNGKNGQPITNQSGLPLTDRERGKIKIPLNKDDPESVKLFELLTEIDKMAENEREKLWGDKKKANAYKYQPMVRQAPEDPENPDVKKPDYFTVKFDFDATGNIKTKVYQNADGDRTELTTPKLDDVTKYVRYKCDYRPVFAFSKLFAGKAADDSGKRKYGFGLKLKHIEVKPSQTSAQEQDENAFVDDEDDEFIERRVLVKETKKVVKDEDEDEDEEEEEEEKPAPKKISAKAVKKVVKEEDQDQDEDEEEEAKPAPKARRGRAARSTDV
jgi:hypothetical protein